MSTCVTCAGLNCLDLPDDSELYSLDREIFPFILRCPEGQDCTEGNFVRFVCCNVTITAFFPPGSTSEQRNLILQDAVNQCSVAAAFCGELDQNENPPDPPEVPPTPPVQEFFCSEPVGLTLPCPDGNFHYRLPACAFTGRTQEEANELATEFAIIDANDKKFCVSIPTMCWCSDVANSFDNQIFGGELPYSIGVTLGYVPAGLSVFVVGSKVRISGTPTTPGIYSFTLNVTDGTGNYWTGVVTFSVQTIGYSANTTANFVVPNVAATVVVSIPNTNMAVGDILKFSEVVGGFNSNELGSFEVTSITPVTLENIDATPGTTIASGTTAYWDLQEVPSFSVGDPYSFQMPAVGGSGTYTWSYTGDLPSGITLTAAGLLAGTPTESAADATISFVDTAC